MDLVWDESGLIWHYMSDRLDVEMHPDNGGFIMLKDGKLVATVGIYDVRDDGHVRQARIAGAAESPRWFTRSTYKAMHEMFFQKPPHGLGLDRLNSLVKVDNEHSIRITERIGFVREGLLRKAGPEGTDLVVFGLLPNDPAPFSKRDDNPAVVQDNPEN